MLAFEVNQWVIVFHETMSDSGSSLRLACFVGLDAVEDALGHLGLDREVGNGRPGFVGHSTGSGSWDVEYLAVGSEEIVSLVFFRYFTGCQRVRHQGPLLRSHRRLRNR
jgi:hypothetical protein